MKKMESIQETLLNLGFVINGQTFVMDDTIIPFGEIIGHTVGSFIEKARRNGWLDHEGRPTGGAKVKSMLLEPGTLLKINTPVADDLSDGTPILFNIDPVTLWSVKDSVAIKNVIKSSLDIINNCKAVNNADYVWPSNEDVTYNGFTYHYKDGTLTRIAIKPEEEKTWEDTPFFWPSWFPYVTD